VHVLAAGEVREDQAAARRRAGVGAGRGEDLHHEQDVRPRRGVVAERLAGRPSPVAALQHRLGRREALHLRPRAVQDHAALVVPARALQHRGARDSGLGGLQQVADLVAVDLHHRDLHPAAPEAQQQPLQRVVREPALSVGVAAAALQRVGLPRTGRAVREDAGGLAGEHALDPGRHHAEDVLLRGRLVEDAVHAELPRAARAVLERELAPAGHGGDLHLRRVPAAVALQRPDAAEDAHRREVLPHQALLRLELLLRLPLRRLLLRPQLLVLLAQPLDLGGVLLARSAEPGLQGPELLRAALLLLLLGPRLRRAELGLRRAELRLHLREARLGLRLRRAELGLRLREARLDPGDLGAQVLELGDVGPEVHARPLLHHLFGGGASGGHGLEEVRELARAGARVRRGSFPRPPRERVPDALEQPAHVLLVWGRHSSEQPAGPAPP